jgi:hypothetical protein
MTASYPTQAVPERRRCEWRKCKRVAVGWWDARWTVVDYGEWYWCEEHKFAMHQYLIGLTFDGIGVQELNAERIWD